MGPCVLVSGEEPSRQSGPERRGAIHRSDWKETATQVSQYKDLSAPPHLEALPHSPCRQDWSLRFSYSSRSAARGDEGGVYATESEED